MSNFLWAPADLPWRRGAALLAAALLLIGWLLNVSRPGRRAVGCAADCAAAPERQPGPLRLLSLNMLHGFPRFAHLEPRLDLIAAEIRRRDADIVLLQEVPWTPQLGNAAHRLAAQTGYNFLYLRANGNRRAILFEEGEAILSRYPLRDASWIELEPQAGWFEHRLALRATAATPWGDLPLIVTHLTNGDAAINRRQADALRAFVESNMSPGAPAGTKIPHARRWTSSKLVQPVREGSGGPVIVAGDFNAKEDSPQMQALAARWVDAYRAVRPDEPGRTCCVDDLTAGPGEPLEKRIDYLFLVPGGEAHVISARRVLTQPTRTAEGWLWASDHVGLLVEVALQEESAGFSGPKGPPPRGGPIPTAAGARPPGGPSPQPSALRPPATPTAGGDRSRRRPAPRPATGPPPPVNSNKPR
ncbi:MAG TPA: hypothetical protein ENJ31_10265 [Anaerolineae bacterium]|nr:hypothetical protein [Anaerolineae bacterium]